MNSLSESHQEFFPDNCFDANFATAEAHLPATLAIAHLFPIMAPTPSRSSSTTWADDITWITLLGRGIALVKPAKGGKVLITDRRVEQSGSSQGS